MVVASAGNDADRHWRGAFTDSDGDSAHEWSGSDERNTLAGGASLDAGERVRVTLNWPDWPTSDQDYDLFLVDDSGTAVAKSTRTQDGDDRPTEFINTTVPESGTYHVVVEQVDADRVDRFELFVQTHDPEYVVANSSIVAPATGEDVIAVGAYDYATGDAESFSAEGPTNDGRPGIDIGAPDRVSTTAYDRPFAGTSAAAPHVGGVAVLLLDAAPSLSNEQVETILEETARGSGGDKLGAGRVDAAAAVNRVADIDVGPPEIQSFSLSSSGSKLTVTIESNESLSNLTVGVADGDGTLVAVLNRSEFSESGDSSYTYTAELDVALGDYAAELASAEDDVGNNASAGQTDTATVSAPRFEVTGLSVADEVVAGNTTPVAITVENTGTESGSQDLSLLVDGTQFNRTGVSLDPGESTTVEFVFPTADRSTGTYTLTASTSDDEQSTTIEIVGPSAPRYEITGVSVPDGAGEGDAVDVSATVENVGDESGNQTITLLVDGTERVTDALPLDPGESATVSTALDLAAGTHTVAFQTANDSREATVNVTAAAGAATFTVASLSVPDSVAAGDPVPVSATIENTGNASDRQVVNLLVDGSILASESVSLAPGESTTVDGEATGLASGDHDVTVTTANDSQSATVTVREAGDGQTVALAPVTTDVATNGTTTVEVVTTPTRGVQNYRLTVATGDASTVVVESVSFPDSVGFGESNVTDGEASLAAISAGIAPTDDRVTLATVTVSGVAEGTATLSLSVESLYDANGTAYRVTDTPGSVVSVSKTVPGVDVDDSGNRSRDVDGDGRHEDVDGDGDFDTSDVQAMLDDLVTDGDTVGRPALYDIDGGGSVGTGDVQALLDELVGSA